MADSEYKTKTEEPTSMKVGQMFYASASRADTPVPEKREDFCSDGYYKWGADNLYPLFIYELYRTTPALASSIDTLIDYTAGDSIEVVSAQGIHPVNSQGETLEDVVNMAIQDLWIQGGFAVEVTRNLLGQITELASIDVSKIRSDIKREHFWYRSSWKRQRGSEVIETREYTKFIPDNSQEVSMENSTSELLYFSNMGRREIYPRPYFESIIPSAQNLQDVMRYYTANLKNQLSLKNIIELNDGLNTGVSEEETEKVQKRFEEHMSGAENAGRFLLSFDKINVKQIFSDDFSTPMQSLRKSSRDDIYQALRVIPQLVGDMSASTGFNTQEFEQAFNLMNSIVRSKKNIITREFGRILGDGAVTINPLTMKQNG